MIPDRKWSPIPWTGNNLDKRYPKKIRNGVAYEKSTDIWGNFKFLWHKSKNKNPVNMLIFLLISSGPQEWFIVLLLQLCFVWSKDDHTRQVTLLDWPVNLNAGDIYIYTNAWLLWCGFFSVQVTLKFSKHLFLWGYELANSFRLFRLLRRSYLFIFFYRLLWICHKDTNYISYYYYYYRVYISLGFFIWSLRAALYKYRLSSFGWEKMKSLKLSQKNGLYKWFT